MALALQSRPPSMLATPSSRVATGAPTANDDMTAAVFAHELNQPIAAATNLLRGLRLRLRNRANALAAEESAALEKALEQLMFAAGVIGRLRTQGRAGSLRFAPVDMHRVVEAGVALLQPVAERSGIAMNVDGDRRSAQVLADAVALQQVIVNLVRNALEAVRDDAPVSPAVRVRVVVRLREVELQIVDNGPGFPAKSVEDAEKPFASTKPGGTGIGLPLSRAIVEAHGGRLWFTRANDRGTTFHIALPLAGSEGRPS